MIGRLGELWAWLVLPETRLPADVRTVLGARIRSGSEVAHAVRIVLSAMGILGAWLVRGSNDPRLVTAVYAIGCLYGGCSVAMLLGLRRGWDVRLVGVVTVVADAAMLSGFSTTSQYNDAGWYEVLLSPVYPGLYLVFVTATLLQYSVQVSLLAGVTYALGRWAVFAYAATRGEVAMGEMTSWDPPQIGIADQYVLVGVILFSGAVTATLARQVRRILVDHAAQAVRTATLERQQDYLRRYLSPQVAQKIIEQDDEAALESTRCRVAVMFVDIRNFTSYAAGTPVDVVVAFLNQHLAGMVEEVFAAQGTLDKFLDDGLMAVFGAPVAMADPGVQALRAASGILRTVQRYNAEKRTEEPVLHIGIGLAVGEVVAGNIGSATRREYTCIGSSVNLAARLQELCKELNTDLVVGPGVFGESGGIGSGGTAGLRFEAVVARGVRGMTEGMTVWRRVEG